MKRNIDRVKKIAEAGMEAGRFLQSCFDWESKPRSITAFVVSNDSDHYKSMDVETC